MRRKCKWQSQRRRKLRAEAARSQQCNWHIAPLAGNCLHYLSRHCRSQICPQFFKQRREIFTTLLQIASQSPHGSEVAAGSASQSQIDSPGIQRLERSKLFRNNQRRMIWQHHAAATHANRLRCRGYMSNQHRCCGAGEPRNGVMFR